MIAVSARTLIRNVGGNTRYAREIYGGLASFGLDHSALAPSTRSTQGWAAWEAFAFQESARNLGARIAHYPADTGAVRRLSRISTVVTIQGVAQLHDTSVRRPIPGKIWLERTRRAGKVADVIVTGSASSADDVAMLVGAKAEDRIRLIPNGIDHRLFNLANGARQADAIAEHGVLRPFVLFVGNLEPRKNIEALVGAVDLLNGDGFDCELLVAGSPAWDSAGPAEAIQASPNSRRLGFVADEHLPGLMAAAAAFAFPSKYEGFGLPVVEALASGATVVCSRNGSLPEVAGPHAHYCETIDPLGIRDALAVALTSGHPTSPARGSAWSERFSWAASAAAHADLFRSLC